MGEGEVAAREDGSRNARRQFGRQAAHYAASITQSGGVSLDLVAAWADLRPTDVALDIATGAGFTAFVLAAKARFVLATDVTPEMLSQARHGAEQRGLRNVCFALSAAEQLPCPAAGFDVVTCRMAAHHFADVLRFTAEAYRVCRAGGQVLFVDTVAPEDRRLATLMNEIERRRDPSHVRNYAPSEWQALFEEQGFALDPWALVLTELEFDDWVRRSGTPPQEVAALRPLLETAAPDAAAAFHIRPEGRQLRFAWDTIVLAARKPAAS